MKKNNKKGFTLVELVIVVAVMAVLVAVAIPTIGSIKGSAEDSVAKSNAKTIESIIKLADANADGTGNVGAGVIAKAIFDAKLGLKTENNKTPTFWYSPTTGAVTVDKTGATQPADAWKIEFSNYAPKETATFGATVDGVVITPTEKDTNAATGYKTGTAVNYPEKPAA